MLAEGLRSVLGPFFHPAVFLAHSGLGFPLLIDVQIVVTVGKVQKCVQGELFHKSRAGQSADDRVGFVDIIQRRSVAFIREEQLHFVNIINGDP
ncbi:hypothetical protein D3C81_1886180 [compost metagenome]